MESCSVTMTHTVVAIQSSAEAYCKSLTNLASLFRLVDITTVADESIKDETFISFVLYHISLF